MGMEQVHGTFQDAQADGRRLVVWGHPRSGTTALCRAIDHPEFKHEQELGSAGGVTYRTDLEHRPSDVQALLVRHPLKIIPSAAYVLGGRPGAPVVLRHLSDQYAHGWTGPTIHETMLVTVLEMWRAALKRTDTVWRLEDIQPPKDNGRDYSTAGLSWAELSSHQPGAARELAKLAERFNYDLG